MAIAVEYTLYKNDKKVMYGTLKEIAEALGKNIGTVHSWKERHLTTKEGYRVEEIIPKPKEKKVKRTRTIIRTSSGLMKWEQ